MRERKEERHSPADRQATPLSPPDPANEPQTRTRRELIARYGKYAIVAAPLLVFVSKARAIHSKP